jgi:hypothetical protein
MTTTNQNCLATYGNCRKSQDIASPAISVCNQNQTALTSKLKSLLDNQAAVNEAQDAIQLKTRKIYLNFRLLKQQTAKCQDAIDLAQDMIDIIRDNPASLLLNQTAKNVTRLTNAADCTADDIATFVKIDGDINATETLIADEVDNVKDSLQGKLEILRENSNSCIANRELQLVRGKDF